MVTMCEDCDNLHSDKGKNPKYWMCTKFPRLETNNFVTKESRITEPYMYCVGINGGACCMFTPKKQKEE